MDEGSPGLAWYGHQVSPQHGYRSCCLLVHFPDKKKGRATDIKEEHPLQSHPPLNRFPEVPPLSLLTFHWPPQLQGSLGNVVFYLSLLLP